MAKGLSPTERTCRLLKQLNYKYGITEVYCQMGMRPDDSVPSLPNGKPRMVPRMGRKDCLGLFDIIAFENGLAVTLGIQCTSVPHINSHMVKAEESEFLVPWLRCGNHFVIHGWYPWSEEDRRDEIKLVSAYLDFDKVLWERSA